MPNHVATSDECPSSQSTSPLTDPPSTQYTITAETGAVAADDHRCSIIGRDVLREGGSAVDAAVACAFCGGVVNPSSSGIGGGAFILIRLASGDTEVIDAREEAPSGASQDMYADNSQGSLTGGLAVGVPGEVAGMHLAWERHGKLPWSRLVTPAADLAHSFKVGHHLASSIVSYQDQILKRSELQKVYAPGGTILKQGESCSNLKLEATLRQIANGGADSFYSGDFAKALAADVQAAGGILTVEDLAKYKPIIREAVSADVMGLTIIGVPPPSSGGLTIISVLKFLSSYAVPLAGSVALGAHRTVEGMKHAFALRMSLGDPLFVPEAAEIQAKMLNDTFIDMLVEGTEDGTTQKVSHYGGKYSQLNDHGTSHLSVVDASMSAVAMTTTINTGFGSKVVSPHTGVLLNNQMDDFSKPGEPNTYGLAPSEANYIRAGKRPLSSMSPTIVLEDGNLRCVTGASGGPRIITATLQTILGVIGYGRSVFHAVHAPRLHHQLLPNVVYSEHQDLGQDLNIEQSEYIETALRKRSHEVKPTAFSGVCHMIAVDIETGNLTAVSDRRKGGKAAGY